MWNTMLISLLPFLVQGGSSNDVSGDISQLNFALTIANAKSAFYKQFMSSNENPESVYNSKGMIRIGEHTHNYKAVLGELVSELGGKPKPPCNYKFEAKTEQDFMTLSRTLGTVGLQAYVTILSELNTPKTRLSLAQITATQARHLAYMNAVGGVDPFPEAKEDTMSSDQALAYLQSFEVDCPSSRRSNKNRRLAVYPSSGPPGTVITYATPNMRDFNNSTPVKGSLRKANSNYYCVFAFSRRQLFATVTSRSKCKVPREASRGIVKIFVTDQRRRVNSQYDEHIIAGPGFFDVKSPMNEYPNSSPGPEFPFPFPFPFPGNNVNNGIMIGSNELNNDDEMGYPISQSQSSHINSYKPQLSSTMYPNSMSDYPLDQPYRPQPDYRPNFYQPQLNNYPSSQPNIYQPQFNNYPQSNYQPQSNYPFTSQYPLNRDISNESDQSQVTTTLSQNPSTDIEGN